MQDSEQSTWRKCSACKKEISYGSKYYVCSVSTCNGQRTGYVFCSVSCFERHLPGARHKDAAAVEMFSPAKVPVSGNQNSNYSKKIYVSQNPNVNAGLAKSNQVQLPKEVLIIASRLKEYIVAKSEMNTSAAVMDALSDYVRIICDRAIENARADGRKTVLDRDFEFLKNLR